MSGIQEQLDKCENTVKSAFSDSTLSAAHWLYSYLDLVDMDDNGGNNLHCDTIGGILKTFGYTGDTSQYEGVSLLTLDDKVNFLANRIVQNNINPILSTIISIEDLHAEELRIQNENTCG